MIEIDYTGEGQGTALAFQRGDGAVGGIVDSAHGESLQDDKEEIIMGKKVPVDQAEEAMDVSNGATAPPLPYKRPL